MKNNTEGQNEQEPMQLEIDCPPVEKKEVPEITENDLWPDSNNNE